MRQPHGRPIVRESIDVFSFAVCRLLSLNCLCCSLSGWLLRRVFFGALAGTRAKIEQHDSKTNALN